MPERPLIIGLGTGRCGTHSLVDVLNAQDGVSVVHEDKPILHWDPTQEDSDVIARFQAKINLAPDKIIGEVALFLLGYTPALLEAFPQARAVVLQRPRDEVIASFARWVRGSARHRRHMNHWQRGARRKRALWDRAFPQFDAPTMEEAIGLYWDWYGRQVEDLMRTYPDRVRQWTMREALNDPSGQREMLQWLGVANPRRHHAWSAWTVKPKRKPAPKPAGRDYTYCIKTFARPNTLRRCLRSIRDRDPARPVIIVDDSKQPYAADVAAETPELNVKVITPGFDVGVSRGRNLAVDAAGTEFVCQLDDDMYLIDETDVPGMISALADGGWDIVTGRMLESKGRVRGWEARFHRSDTVLYAQSCPPQERIQPVDMGMNFLVTRASTMQRFRYCDEIKIGREHMDFFLTVHRGGGRVACYAPSLIGHRHDKANRVYRRMRRDRRKAYDRLVMQRHGLSHVIMPTGEVLTCPENFSRLGPQGKWTDTPAGQSGQDRNGRQPQESPSRRLLGTEDLTVSKKPELAVLYCCHTLDASARANLQTLRWYNPDVCVHIVENSRPTRRDGWRNADQVLCEWYLAHRPDAERFVLIELDMLCTVSLREHFADTWDADISAANVRLPGRDDRWPWWSEVGRLPADMQPHATGAVPLAGILFSRRALDAIAPVICRPEMNDIFAELRVGTVAASLGLKIAETGPHAKCTVKGRGRFRPDQRRRPGLYHKVKGRRAPRILVGALSGSSPLLVRRRESCRRTWFTGVGGREGVDCLFLMGDPGLSKPELRGDELWLPCPDDYASLPQKTHLFCRWALENAEFEYIFKCDDDTYVCLERLLAVPSGLDYCGWKLGKRNYASGGAGYLLSRRAAEIVARDVVEETGPEDRLVGQHLHRAGIALVHDPRFRPWRKLSHTPRPDNDLITGHYCGHIRICRVHRQFARR